MSVLMNASVIVSVADRASRNLEQIGNKFGEIDRKSKQAQESMERLEKFTFVSGGMAAGGAAITYGLNQAVQRAGDFEAQMKKVFASMSDAEIEKYGQQLSDLALTMASEYGKAPVEVAAGIESLIKAGVDAQRVLGGSLRDVLNLSAAGDVTADFAAMLASDSVNAFSSSLKDTAQAADILVGTADASSTNVEELRYALASMGPVGEQAKMTFQDMNNVLAIFANNNLKGSDAGTSLKTMLLNLQPTTKQQIELFERFNLIALKTNESAEFLARKGIKVDPGNTKEVEAALRRYAAAQDNVKLGTNAAEKAYADLVASQQLLRTAFFDSSGALKDMAEVADILQEKFGKLSPDEQMSIAEAIGGTDAIRAIGLLIKEGGDAVRKIETEINKVSAADKAQKRMEGLNASIKEFGATANVAAISVGDKLAPAVEELSDNLKYLVGQYNSLSEGTQTWIAYTAAGAAVGLTLLGTLGLIAMGIGQIRMAFGGLKGSKGLDDTGKQAKRTKSDFDQLADAADRAKRAIRSTNLEANKINRKTLTIDVNKTKVDQFAAWLKAQHWRKTVYVDYVETGGVGGAAGGAVGGKGKKGGRTRGGGRGTVIDVDATPVPSTPPKSLPTANPALPVPKTALPTPKPTLPAPKNSALGLVNDMHGVPGKLPGKLPGAAGLALTGLSLVPMAASGTLDDQLQQHGAEMALSAVGSVAGGILAGALGSVVPGAGTVIGGVIGSTLGGMGGAALGRLIDNARNRPAEAGAYAPPQPIQVTLQMGEINVNEAFDAVESARMIRQALADFTSDELPNAVRRLQQRTSLIRADYRMAQME